MPRDAEKRTNLKDNDKENERLSFMEFNPPYSPTVLVGNWSTDRYERNDVPNNAILPGLTSPGCERHQTVNQVSYTKGPKDEITREFLRTQLQVFQNESKVKESHIHLRYAKKYLKNFTTTNTLMFDLLPKMRLQHCLSVAKRSPPGQEHFMAVHERVVRDPLDCYGNNGGHHMTYYRKCQEFMEKFNRNKTSYSLEFRAPKIVHDEKQKLNEGSWIKASQMARHKRNNIILNCTINDDFISTTK